MNVQFIFQKKSLIFSVLFFLLLCFVFLILYNKTIDSQSRYMDASKELQETEKEGQAAKSLVNGVESVKEESLVLEKHFIKSSDVVSFLDTIENLGKQAHTDSEIIAVDIAKDNRSLSVDVKVQGSFENVYKFVLLMENSPYLVKFISADISKVDSSKSNWIGQFKINLISFMNK